MNQETLGQMLKRFREEAGLTQAELAERAGVSLRTIQGWEIDRRAAVRQDILRTMDVLGFGRMRELLNAVWPTKPKRSRGRPKRHG